MFQLHDSARRRIAMAAFVALCVVPTAVVVICGLARHTPGHVRTVATRLSWQLNQRVSLARVRYLRPGVVRYEGLELADPETGDRILRCRSLQVSRERPTDHEGRGRSCLVMTASRAELEAGRLDQVWQLVRRALTGRIGSVEWDARLAATEVTLRHGDASHAITQLRGRIDRLPGGSQADVTFRLAELETPEPIQVRVARNGQTEPPASGLGVYTGGGALPCSLLALAVPEFEAMGPESRFSGYVWANETDEGWGGVLEGEFSGVDLERLVAGRFPHTLAGAAELTVKNATVRQGRLEEAAGSLVAGPGTISRSLLDAAAGRLGMARGPEPRGSGQLVAYDRLALSFRIDSHGLQLQGACPPAGCGIVLVGRSGPLLGEPPAQPVPMAALIQTLAPAGAIQVPATRETDWLMRRLPVHDAFPLRTAVTPSRPAE